MKKVKVTIETDETVFSYSAHVVDVTMNVDSQYEDPHQEVTWSPPYQPSRKTKTKTVLTFTMAAPISEQLVHEAK